MFRYSGFKEIWRPDFTAEKAAGKSRPRCLVDACGAPIRWGVESAAALAAKDLDEGQEFEVNAWSRVQIQETAKCVALAKLPKELIPDSPGTKVSVIFDSAKALEGLRAEGGKVFVPFDLGLPSGASMRFQPDLMREEHDEGCTRPPLVVGSWAIHAPCDGGTGHWNPAKIGHLYRPFVVDFKGEWAWCDWILEAGRLWAVLPLAWLESAERQWPIILDPVFGHSGTPGTQASSGGTYWYSNGLLNTGYLAPAAGNIYSIEMYCLKYTTSQQFTLGIHATTSNAPGATLCDTGGGVSPDSVAWVSQTVDSPVGGYNMALNEGLWMTFHQAERLYCYYDLDAAYKRYYNTPAYSHGAMPAGPGTGGSTAMQMGLRVNYTASGGGGQPPRSMHAARMRRGG